MGVFAICKLHENARQTQILQRKSSRPGTHEAKAESLTLHLEADASLTPENLLIPWNITIKNLVQHEQKL